MSGGGGVDDAGQPAAAAAVDDGGNGDGRDLRRRDDQNAVRVKPEYVLPEEEEPPEGGRGRGDGDDGDGGGVDGNLRDDDDDGGVVGKNAAASGKKNRGTNKKRPRDAKIEHGEKACVAAIRGLPCPFLLSGKGCKYNHDLGEMLANRPPDIHEGKGGAAWLEGGCPFWTSRG